MFLSYINNSNWCLSFVCTLWSGCKYYFKHWLFFSTLLILAQSAGAVEYTDCTSAEVKNPTNERPGYGTKQSDDEVPVMLERWGMQSTPLLPLLPGPIWSGVVEPDKCPMYGLNRTKPCFLHNTAFCIETAYLCWIELFEIELFWHLTLCIAQSAGAVEYNNCTSAEE